MRYKEYGQLDDPPLIDGDESFIGLVTRESPDNLEPGMLSWAENVRLKDGTISPRLGVKALLTEDQADTLHDDLAFDCAPYNLDNQANDSVLIAGKTQAFLYDNGTISDVSYPPDIYKNQFNDESLESGFLLNTSLSTILFPDPSPNLNLTLGQSKLGRQPMRVRSNPDSSLEFIYHKQESITECLPEENGVIGVKTENTSSFIVGELVKIFNLPGTGIYRVTEVNDKVIKLKKSDNETRPTWVVVQPDQISGAIIYSIDDQCPSAKFATWAGNRLIVPAGNDDIFISSPLSTHDFPDYNRLTIGSADTGNITALEPMVDDSLIVFKDHSIHLVSGVYSMRTQDQGGNLAIARISDQLGCTNQNAVQVVGQEIMFYNRQGLYGLTLNAKGAGSVGLPPQAVRINDIALSRDIENLLDDDNYKEASLEFYKGRVYLVFPFVTQRRVSPTYTHVFVYCTMLGRWESRDEYRGQGYKLFTLNRDKAELAMFDLDQGLLLLEEEELKDKYINGDYDITTNIATRGYRCKTFSQKQFRRNMFTLSRSTAQTSDMLQTSMNFDGEQSTQVNYRNSYDGNGNYVHKTGTHQYREKLRSRADSAQFRLNSRGLRYNLKRVAIEATEASRSTRDL